MKNSIKDATMGLGARRRLCRKYNPANALSNRRLLKRLSHPVQVSFEDLRRAIEEWEADFNEYNDRTRKSLDDDQIALALQDMCPELLQNHIELHAARMTTADHKRD